MAQLRYINCFECGTTFQADLEQEQCFCTGKCKDRWNNRRRLRGAELYDLFMNMRFDRAAAKEAGVWSVMCRMASQWRHEDDNAFNIGKTKRPGRKSFSPIRRVLQRNVRYQAVLNRVSRKIADQ